MREAVSAQTKQTEEAERERPREAAVAPVAGLSAQAVLGLQRRAGNRATAAMLARRETGKTLNRSSLGDEVKALQSKLNTLSCVHTPLLPDGSYGDLTDKAVREFQQAHPPLKASGQADPETLAAIDAAQAEKQDDTVLAEKCFKLGAASYEQGRFGQAYDYFTRAGELVPERPGVVFSRAQALRRM